MISIAVADICSAFRPKTIGSKVTSFEGFLGVLTKAVESFAFEECPIPGQGFLDLPEAIPFVSSGVGHRRPSAEDYVCREHRGVVSAYLKREFAEPPKHCSAVVYTLGAYAKDPDVLAKEAEHFKATGVTHVLVAVLARPSLESPLLPYRLVWNLAGGNREAALWSADEIREKAKAAIAYDNEWDTAADA